MNQWHCLGLFFYGEIKKTQTFKNLFYFCFPRLYRQCILLLPVPAGGCSTALPLPWYRTSENILQDPPPSFNLIFPWHSQPLGHVESKSKPLTTSFRAQDTWCREWKNAEERRGPQDKVSGTLRDRQCRTNVGGTPDLCPADGTSDKGMGGNSDSDSDSKSWRTQKEKRKNKYLKMAFCTNNTNYSHSCELIAIFSNHHAAYWQ